MSLPPCPAPAATNRKRQLLGGVRTRKEDAPFTAHWEPNGYVNCESQVSDMTLLFHRFGSHKNLSSDVRKHRQQLILHAREPSLAEARGTPLREHLQLFGRIRTKVNLRGLEALVPQPQ